MWEDFVLGNCSIAALVAVAAAAVVAAAVVLVVGVGVVGVVIVVVAVILPMLRSLRVSSWILRSKAATPSETSRSNGRWRSRQ